MARPTLHRRSAPRSIHGIIVPKNNLRRTRQAVDGFRIERRRPRRGSRHLVTTAQLRTFLELLPDEAHAHLQGGLLRFIFGAGDDHCFGWYRRGTVCLHAWERELVLPDCPASWVTTQRRFLARLGVPVLVRGREKIDLLFDEDQARAYQLLNVLSHEIGHLIDAETNRRGSCARGEPFAVDVESRWSEALFERYQEAFRVVF